MVMVVGVLSPMWISGILTVVTLGGLLVVLSWGKRREMRISADEWREAREKFERFAARNPDPDASGGDLGHPDPGGQAASPPDG